MLLMSLLSGNVVFHTEPFFQRRALVNGLAFSFIAQVRQGI